MTLSGSECGHTYVVRAAGSRGEPRFLGDGSDTPAGFSLAIASGAVTMGLGYIVWYLAVLHLTVGQAASGQRSAVAAGGHGAGRRGIAG